MFGFYRRLERDGGRCPPLDAQLGDGYAKVVTYRQWRAIKALHAPTGAGLSWLLNTRVLADFRGARERRPRR